MFAAWAESVHKYDNFETSSGAGCHPKLFPIYVNLELAKNVFTFVQMFWVRFVIGTKLNVADQKSYGMEYY